MAQEMTPEEYRSFLTAGTRTAKVATVGAGVRPHVVPGWFVIEGAVETSPNPPDMLDWCTRIARRYMGADLAEAYGKRNAVEGELLVRVMPTRVIARKGIAD